MRGRARPPGADREVPEPARRRAVRRRDTAPLAGGRPEAGLPHDEHAAGRWSVDHVFLDQDAVPTLAEDHARPRRLAERWPSSRAAPATRPSWRPIVALQVADAPASVAALAEHRLRMKARSARHLRQLTHLDVAHEGIERALSAATEVARLARRGGGDRRS